MRLPLAFEANRGQLDPRAGNMTRSDGATVFPTDNKSAMVLPGKPMVGPAKPDPHDAMAYMAMVRGPEAPRRGPGAGLRMRVVGARKAPFIAGAQALPGITNYLMGNDPTMWRTSVRTCRQVRCLGAYPGADLVYYGNPQRPEYRFVLKPGAGPRRTCLAFYGTERLPVAANGDLTAPTSTGEAALKRLFA